MPPNRRHVAQGLYLPSSRKERLRAVVAVDTSGSTTNDLPQFFSELGSLLETFGDYELTVIQCDSKVQDVKQYDAYDRFHSPEWKTCGGGGTDFRPPFDYVAEHPEIEPSCLVYVTDGFGPAPDRPPPYPVLWVLTHDGRTPAPWGLTLRLKEHAYRAAMSERDYGILWFSKRGKGMMTEHETTEYEWAVVGEPKIPAGTLFSIPPYQRGYRWTSNEVKALLNDLSEFWASDEKVYCLQPLVVQALGNGKYNVVDGQQRLTTLSIIFHALGISPQWEIEYTAENGKQLCDLLNAPDPARSINDYFRCGAQEAIVAWLAESPERAEALRSMLRGESDKRVVFLRHELSSAEKEHDAFQRLNAGKTPLTSAELVRALFMEAGNGLSDGEKTDISKEWDETESAMKDDLFWAIWPTERFRDIPTRMDFLFSIVSDVPGDSARQDPLAVYRAMEALAKGTGLAKAWEEVLRCWWWMNSCHADPETYHLLGWLSLFTKHETRVLYRREWREKSGCRMDAFKQRLREIVAEDVSDGEAAKCTIDFFRYDTCDSETLRKVLVLLNVLEAERRNIRFRFDLYRLAKGSWDVEHIASQTDNPLSDKEAQTEWLELARAEMPDEEKSQLDGKGTFSEKWVFVWSRFGAHNVTADKNDIGNLALLDAGTNRGYGNAIFPAKRRRILLETKRGGAEGRRTYIPPVTMLAFAKTYSSAAVQMRYWSETDARNYRVEMASLFDGFMAKVKKMKENLK